MLGFNRYLIELGQSLGLGRSTMIVALVSIVMTTSSLYTTGRHGHLEVAASWMIGQLTFYLGMKILFHYRAPEINGNRGEWLVVASSVALVPLFLINSVQLQITLCVLVSVAFVILGVRWVRRLGPLHDIVRPLHKRN
jgi:hypothetical protein